MKITLSPSIINLANKVAKVPGLKMLLKPFYYRYKAKIEHNRNKQFQANGLSVLQLFDKIMVENNIPYSVFAGTLLGAVREHGFISHDVDIDTAVFYDERPDDLSDILESYGFKLVHSFTVKNGVMGMEETYIKDNVTLDIFYVYYDENGETYQCDFYPEKGVVTWEESMKKFGYVWARKLKLPMSHSFTRVPFHHISLSIINNYDEWLTSRYGKTYMVPDPNFHDDGTNRQIIDNWMKACYNVYPHHK